MIGQVTACPVVPLVGEACEAVAGAVLPEPAAPPAHEAGFLDGPLFDGGLIGRGVDAARDSVGGMIAGWFLDAASWFLDKLWGLALASSAVQLDAEWFTRQYARVAEVAVPLALVMLFLAVIAALRAGDNGELVSAAAFRLPWAFVLGALAIPVVTIGVALMDAIAVHLVGDIGADVEAGISSLSANLATIGGDGTPALVAILAGLLIVVAVAIAWLWLTAQAVAIYLCVVFLPVMFVMGVHRATRTWAPRIGWLLLALLISKPVLVTCLALGVGALAGSGEEEAYAGVFQGAFTIGMAALSPMAVLAFVPAAAAAGGATSGPRRSAHRAHVGASRARRAVTSRRGSTVAVPPFRASARSAPPPPPPTAPRPTPARPAPRRPSAMPAGSSRRTP